MLSRLLLIRHGRSAHVHHGGWVDAFGVRQWRAVADEAGIEAEDMPPVALAKEVERAELVVSSDLPRAVASAERLAPGRSIVPSPLLRETPLDIPQLPVRLPLELWELLIHVGWGYRILTRADAHPEEIRRAATAVGLLADLAQERSSIAVVTHGVFRRLLASQLLAVGWRGDGKPRRYHHWSC
jgi:broad specificity phosphatase PhoE